MKEWLDNIYTFFPVQLLLLHLRKSQILLLFWVLLFLIIGSKFLHVLGTDALFFAPEYLGSVNIFSALFTGSALAVYIMAWNITTFIMHSRRFRFLATTKHPFLKYCVNNSIIPLLFLIFYFYKLYHYDTTKELMAPHEVMVLLAGIFIGLVLTFLIAFVYFFSAGHSIHKRTTPIIEDREVYKKFSGLRLRHDEISLKVKTYLEENLHLQIVRNVGHYRQDYLAMVFQRHHLAAMFAFLFAFLFLVTVGFNLDNKFFEMPAAAGILIFFGVLIALIGALVYILKSWSLLVAFLVLAGLNLLYSTGLMDFRNKAYGLSYSKPARAQYTEANLNHLAAPDKIAADKANMIYILNKWKNRQPEEKPPIIFINVSGGGLRSATFVMNTLQQLDSLSNGQLMKKTFLITGASGGMMAATYYRELYKKSFTDSTIRLSDPQYLENISGDLLNPVFASIMARDILSPVQKFKVNEERYIKDRGFAFENKLNIHTEGVLNKSMADCKADEADANAPLIFFNAVVKKDARKMVISTQPVSFMMKPAMYQNDTLPNIDAIDFGALFYQNDYLNLRLLTALRMNATFPYVLPSVWLPTNPVVDVMDAGLRDNQGQESAYRFINTFSDWLLQNTSRIMVLELRGRQSTDWNIDEKKSMTDILIAPGTVLYKNWFHMQNFTQIDQYDYLRKSMNGHINHVEINYIPEEKDNMAALSFHLTKREKRDVVSSFYNPQNKNAVDSLLAAIR